MTRQRQDVVLQVLDHLALSGRRTWLGVFAFTLVIFAVSSHWWTGQVSDAEAASWPAWQLARHGTLDLTGAPLPNIQGFQPVGSSIVVLRTMGVVLAAVPLNFLLRWTDLSPTQIGALTGSLTSAVAVSNVALLLRTVTGPHRAVRGALLLAFGTGMWTIASAELWTHGPTTMWLSLGLVMLARDRLWWAGLALAPALVTRPHLALTIAAIGLWLGWARKSLRPVVSLAVPALVGLVVLVVWNRWYFGQASVEGNYHGAISVAVRPLSSGLTDFATNIAGTFVSGWCGFLLFSPVALVLLIGLPGGWRVAPAYARGALVGGLAYLAVQLRVDTFLGGGTFYGNRLVLELFVLASPVLALGYDRWAAGRPRRQVVAASLAAVSVAIHALGVMLADFLVGGTFSDWTVWYPTVVVRAAGPAGLMVVALLIVGVLASVRSAFRTAGRTSAAQAVALCGVGWPSASDLVTERLRGGRSEHGLELEQTAEHPVDKSGGLVGRQ